MAEAKRIRKGAQQLLAVSAISFVVGALAHRCRGPHTLAFGCRASVMRSGPYLASTRSSLSWLNF